MDFFTLQRLRMQQGDKRQELQQEKPQLINTQFVDNHGVVISGGNNNVHIHMHDGKIEVRHESESMVDRICKAIDSIVADGMIAQKQDFAAFHKILEERIYKKLGFTAFTDMVAEKCKIPVELMPTCNNIKRIVFKKSSYPNWIIEGFDINETQRYVNIAGRLLELIG